MVRAVAGVEGLVTGPDFGGEKSPVSEVLAVEGDLTIGRAAELKACLMGALQRANHLDLEIGDITGADLSFLQILCSAHRTARSAGKSLVIHQKAPGPFLRLADQAGFTRHKGCRFDAERTCLWVAAGSASMPHCGTHDGNTHLQQPGCHDGSTLFTPPAGDE